MPPKKTSSKTGGMFSSIPTKSQNLLKSFSKEQQKFLEFFVIDTATLPVIEGTIVSKPQDPQILQNEINILLNQGVIWLKSPDINLLSSDSKREFRNNILIPIFKNYFTLVTLKDKQRLKTVFNLIKSELYIIMYYSYNNLLINLIKQEKFNQEMLKLLEDIKEFTSKAREEQAAVLKEEIQKLEARIFILKTPNVPSKAPGESSRRGGQIKRKVQRVSV